MRHFSFMDFRTFKKILLFCVCTGVGGELRAGCRCRGGEVSPAHYPNVALFAKRLKNKIYSLSAEGDIAVHRSHCCPAAHAVETRPARTEFKFLSHCLVTVRLQIRYSFLRVSVTSSVKWEECIVCLVVVLKTKGDTV